MVIKAHISLGITSLLNLAVLIIFLHKLTLSCPRLFLFPPFGQKLDQSPFEAHLKSSRKDRGQATAFAVFLTPADPYRKL